MLGIPPEYEQLTSNEMKEEKKGWWHSYLFNNFVQLEL